MTAIGEPTERYVTAAELAEQMGVSVRTVKRWTREGLPSETWGMRVRRYQLSRAVAWATSRGGPILNSTDNTAARRLTSAEAERSRGVAHDA